VPWASRLCHGRDAHATESFVPARAMGETPMLLNLLLEHLYGTNSLKIW